MQELLHRYRKSVNNPKTPKDYLVLFLTFFPPLVYVIGVFLFYNLPSSQQHAQTAQPTLTVAQTTVSKGTSVMISWANLPLPLPTSTPTPAPPTPTPTLRNGVVTVLSPNGGETVTLGQPITITWNFTYDNPDPNREFPTVIVLDKENPNGTRQGAAQVNTISKAGSNSFTWTTPTTYFFNGLPIVPGNNFRMGVVVTEPFYNPSLGGLRQPGDHSDNFITVVSPTGKIPSTKSSTFSLKLPAGKAYAQSTYPYGPYIIDLHKKGDVNSTNAYRTDLNCVPDSSTNNPQSSGSCNFYIRPTIESGIYEFSIHANADPYSTPLAVSNPITIEDSSPDLPGYSMHLLYPNGGEQFSLGESVTIRWKLDYWNQNVQLPLTTSIQPQKTDRRLRRGVSYPGTFPPIPIQFTAETLPNTESSQTVTIPAETPPGCNYRFVISVTEDFQLPNSQYAYPSDESDGDLCIGQTSSVTPTPTGNMGIGTTNPMVTPTPTPTPAPCTIGSASWGLPSNPVNEGSSVSLNVATSGECTAKQVQFLVRENDSVIEGGLDENAQTQPVDANIINNSASGTWIAEFQNDCNGLCNPPEYFFTAQVMGETQVPVRSSDPLLNVSQVIQPTPTPTPTLVPTATPTPIGGLKPPTSLTATPLNKTQIRLNWIDTNTTESGYKIERSTNPTSGFVEINKVGTNKTTFNSGGLKTKTTYYYRVRAYGTNNTFSSYSTVVSATTL